MSEPEPKGLLDKDLVKELSEDDYTEALERMEPLEAAAHRAAKVIGCAGVLLGLVGGFAGGIAAVVYFGEAMLFWGILAGSGVPFFFTALLEVNNRLAIRRARKKRLSVGTHGALNAYDPSDDD